MAEAAEKGDPVAAEVYRVCGENLGKGLAVLVDLLNPEIIVIGSIFARSRELLWPHARAVLFCGTGMGIHIAASKCPHVHSAVVESVPAALRCVTANNCNVMAMGGFYVAPRTGMAMADAFLEHKLGDGYEEWEGFYEYHKLGYDELENFDYEVYKANGFSLPNPGTAPLGAEPKGLAY